MPFKCVSADKIYQKDPNLKKQDVEEIQKWLKTQPHLPKVEDTQILTFLHKSHYEKEAAKKIIDNYFTFRTRHLNILRALTPDVLKTVTSVTCFNIMPNKTPEGYIVLMVKLLDSRVSNFNNTHVLTLGFMVAALHYHQYGFENGMVLLIDLKDFSVGHFLKTDFSLLRCVFGLLQNGAPMKIKGIHLVNATPLTKQIIALFKHFLKAKLYQKIQVHVPNSTTVYEFLPKECLCEEHDGCLSSSRILNEQTLQNMLDNYEFFSWYDSQKVDETKRKGNGK
ncbi:hypothetical protein Zmor_008128 [Zophobas morio]|uniref:CRAL-TRIO domain-containing protein n=1 Tax=Zophobas morio TaxID=2755281 RepID=A0AA38J0P2_9CUCU|nr:hypothetical protein Zmor_008128 [Zophobas morio]